MATAKNLTPVLPFLIFCRHFMVMANYFNPSLAYPDLLSPFHGNCQTANPSLAFPDLLSPFSAMAKHLTPVSLFLIFCRLSVPWPNI
jgi:hypothetical protein